MDVCDLILNHELVVSNARNVAEVPYLELNQATAVNDCLSDLVSVRAGFQLLGEDLAVLVDHLQGVHNLGADARVGELYFLQLEALLFEFLVGSLLVHEHHVACFSA